MRYPNVEKCSTAVFGMQICYLGLLQIRGNICEEFACQNNYKFFDISIPVPEYFIPTPPCEVSKVHEEPLSLLR
jgi:hypothetical protein